MSTHHKFSGQHDVLPFRHLTALTRRTHSIRQGGIRMKVKIDSQCMGDRNCNNLCPEVFEYDEDQLQSIVKFDVIPEKYEEVVRQAASECGADAIEIIED
jgi:ferredoxin